MDDTSVRCSKLLIILINFYNEKHFSSVKIKISNEVSIYLSAELNFFPSLLLIIHHSVFHRVKINQIDCPLPCWFRHSLYVLAVHMPFLCFYLYLWERSSPQRLLKIPLMAWNVSHMAQNVFTYWSILTAVSTGLCSQCIAGYLRPFYCAAVRWNPLLPCLCRTLFQLSKKGAGALLLCVSAYLKLLWSCFRRYCLWCH